MAKDEVTEFQLTEFYFNDLLQCFESNELEFIAHALDTFGEAKDLNCRDRSFLFRFSKVFFQEVLKRKMKNVRS